MEIDRSIVLDANILMRAVPGRKVREIITEHVKHVAFYAPQIAYDDARRHLPAVFARRGWSDQKLSEAFAVIDALEPVVHAVEEEMYASKRSAAMARIEKRDPADWHISRWRSSWTARCGPRTTTSSARACRPGPPIESGSTSHRSDRNRISPTCDQLLSHTR